MRNMREGETGRFYLYYRVASGNKKLIVGVVQRNEWVAFE